MGNTVEDLKAQRDWLVAQVESIKRRLKTAAEQDKERLVSKHKQDFDKTVKEFKQAHIAYVLKCKEELSLEKHMEVYQNVDDLCVQVEVIVEDYSAQQLQKDLLTTKTRLVVNFQTEAERITGALSSYVDSNASYDRGVMELELKHYEDAFYAAKIEFKQFFTIESDPTRISSNSVMQGEYEARVRSMLVELRSRHTPSETQSIASGRSTPSGSNVFKTKRMDFPKFSGQIRRYITFKRDFKESVEASGEFTDPQMSQILRNECLSDAPRTLVANVYEYSEVWSRLDDAYMDEQQVIEEVTHELTRIKKIEDSDFNGFIALVDQVERAHLDLTALGDSQVMSNPMTIALVLERCPDWVKMAAASTLSRTGPASRDFSAVLALLVEKRREARTLQNWRGPEGKKAVTAVRTQKPAVGRALVASESKKPTGEKQQKTQKGPSCSVPTCTYRNRHGLSECRAFKKLSPAEKGQHVMEHKLCKLCFASSHLVNDCPKKETWKPCNIEQCGVWHSRLLHGATASGTALTITTMATGSAMLPVQQIQTSTGMSCYTLWDSGSTISLVTFDFAKRAGLEGPSCHLDLEGVQDAHASISSKLYCVELVDRRGEMHKVFAFGVEKITSPIPAANVAEARGLFPQHADRLADSKGGTVELLVGMQVPSLHPVRIGSHGDLSVYESEFGMGCILTGVMSGMNDMDPLRNVRTLLLRSKEVKTIDFLSAEALGVDIPKRCRVCIACKECNFKSHQLTWRESMELCAIEAGLTLDTVKGIWTAEYPFKQDPALLQDNRSQVVSCMLSLEKRLAKAGQLEAFDQQFLEAVDRGVFRPLTKTEAAGYKGPINYVSIVEAYKPGPHVTTPIRLCMNSSLKFRGISLNDILVKGPSSLNDIFSVMLGFRRYRVGLLMDISKFYQSVHSCERDQHLRRVLWRAKREDSSLTTFVTTRVNFGDRPAGCVAQAALRETAKLYSHISTSASEKLICDTYCDDVVTGGGSVSEVNELAKEMREIVSLGGFSFKDQVVSGQCVSGGENLKVLGTFWDSKVDTLAIDIHVNYAEKVKGLRTEKNLELHELLQSKVVITKRLVWRVVLGQFDLLGLVCVFTIRLKLIMRMLSTQEGQKIGWDEKIPDQVALIFLDTLKDMFKLRQIAFPRYIGPSNLLDCKDPIFVAFGDGSQLACCALVYVCWVKSDGHHECRLIAGKTRVAPLRKISVPRLELIGALMAVRLVNRVIEVLKLKDCPKRLLFTDSAAVLAMIKGESSAMKEFVGTRVGEIKSKSDASAEWFWIPTDCNVADLGTRDRTSPEEMVPGGTYQAGPEWLRKQRSTWPIKDKPGLVPSEELVLSARVAVARQSPLPIIFSDYKDFQILVRTVMWICSWVWSVREKKKPWQYFTQARQQIVKDTLISLAQEQAGVFRDQEKYSSLRPVVHGFLGCFGQEVKLCTVGGRLQRFLSVGYDRETLPLLPAHSGLSKLITRSAHAVLHSGVDRTTQLARNTAWITSGRRVAKAVVSNCFECKRRNKDLLGQQMAPLPAHRIPPAPVFSSVAVDLFGPLKIRDSVKKRVTKDTWGVIFVCTFTSAVHIEVAESYSCDSFLQCLRRFMNVRGVPNRIQSDPGTQLTAAASVVKDWDFSRVLDWACAKSIEWHIIPANSQHYNGCAESMIKQTKRQLAALMAGKHLTFGELSTLLSEVAQIINSRPLMKTPGDDVLAGAPITPLHLMLGRSTIHVPAVNVENSARITRRLKYLEEVKEEFWKKWFCQVFHNLAPSYRWRKKARDVKVGDVVLMKDASLLSKSYRLALVVCVKPGADGHVRSVSVKYRNVGTNDVSGQDVIVERSIHSLVVIVPEDWKPEDIEMAVADDINQLDMARLGGV